MAKEKTISDVIENPKDLPFEERAKRYEEELMPIMEKWGVGPWAGLTNTVEMIAAVPMLKDLFAKKEDAVPPTETA